MPFGPNFPGLVSRYARGGLSKFVVFSDRNLHGNAFQHEAIRGSSYRQIFLSISLSFGAVSGRKVGRSLEAASL